MEIKPGDIVIDRDYARRNHPYTYGLVVRITGPVVWCWWAQTLQDLKNKRYTCDRELNCEIHRLDIVEKSKKEIKEYGISKFLTSITNREG